uniref:protein-serine/threonine phosphatase n=1 Tax=Kalanchoe fedtschenkoi TaxID=63787 RepID=A0A7N0T9G6_KALFE
MGGCVSTSTRSSKSVGHSDQGPSSWHGCRGSRRDVIALQDLRSIPNQIVSNGKIQSSCIFTQQGRKGINQDAMIVWEDFLSEDVTFCGVFDGHGPHGHLVSRIVRDKLPLKLLSSLRLPKLKHNGSGRTWIKGGGKNSIAEELEKDEDAEDKQKQLWMEAFLKSFKSMDKELRSHPSLDCFCSGSTAVTVVKQGSKLFIGNIGDSRAILATKDSSNSIRAVQLTVDLKPDLPREAERINRCKGRVFALQDEPEVSRVWLPFDNAPGLAMARAFGDFCLKEYGVISVPEFSHRNLTVMDEFIVLASDGVWDVLSNEQVVEIVASAPTRSSAARTVVDAASQEWRQKYPTSKMDDCAVVCLFLDGKMDCESDFDEQGFSSALHSNHSTAAVDSDDGHNLEPTLQRNVTVRSASEDSQNSEPSLQRYFSMKATFDETEAAADQNWSGLEGVTRVNSLVQLPRFSDERAKS